MHKDKDCTQLEKSSRIPFEYWKSTVELLTSDTPYNTSSILHYISGPLKNLDIDDWEFPEENKQTQCDK